MPIDTTSERFRAALEAFRMKPQRRDKGKAALAAALEAWEAAAWRPIEEYPNDGEYVLTWDPDYPDEVLHLCRDEGPPAKWYGGDCYVDSNPTHFRPLPAPPPQDPAP